MKNRAMFIAWLMCTHAFSEEDKIGDATTKLNFSETENVTLLEKSSPNEIPTKDKARGPILEVKGGYFFFSEHTMRKVYNQGGEDVQLCLSYPVWKIWNVYGSIEYLERHGKSLNGHQSTRIEALPLTIGIKPIIPITSSIDFYATLGPRYTFVWVRNHSSYVDKHMHKSGFGGFVGTGFNFHFAKHWLLDLFGEYNYTRLHFHSSKHNSIGESRQVGGFTFGLGLGYQW